MGTGVVSWRVQGTRRWAAGYLVLSKGELLCYTDTTGLRSAAPQLRLQLAGCEVDWYCARTRKSGHRLLVSPLGQDAVQLKVEDETESHAWYQALQRAVRASKLETPQKASGISAPTGVVKASPEELLRLLAPSPPQPVKLDRSRGLSRSFRKMADSVHKRQASTKNRNSVLASFSFNRKKIGSRIDRRPTVEAITAQGILKSASVFGCPLHEQQLDECRTAAGKIIKIPPFVWKSVQKLESSQEYLETDGLYRVPGDAAKVQKIRVEVDQNKWAAFDSCTDASVIAGALKLYLRELPEPLLPYKLHSELVKAAKKKGSHGDDIAKSMEVMLDKINCPVVYATLEVLVMHLGRVAEAANRMDIDNLGLLFGQVLLWPDPMAPVDMKFLSEAANNCHVADALIRYREEIFHQDPESSFPTACNPGIP